MGRPAKILKKEDIQRAMKMTRSNRAAARYLHVSFTHYKKYAKTYKDEESGSSLFELHKNQVLDTKVPLVLNHKDGNKKNWHLDNLEFLCYNHAFLYATSPITDKQVEAMEDYVDKNVKEVDWELDEHHIEHLKELGLYQEKEKPGEKYISRQ